MANTFLDITNAVLRRFNEVELTGTTFASARGFHAQTKDAVNAALRAIYKDGVEWPFNHVVQTDTLIPGTLRYDLPPGTRSVDMESFRLVRDAALNCPAKWLRPIGYDEFLQQWVKEEGKTADEGGLPSHVFLDRAGHFGVVPVPDKPYQVTYEYYANPPELVAATDVPTVPEEWKYVIVDGAVYYCHLFRDNPEAAALTKQDFEKSLRDMRRIAINRNETMRSTMRVWR